MSIIIGIDHGYYAIKTAHCSFPAGLTSYGEHEPYTRQGLLEFGGCFFVCGTGRQPIQRDKTINDNYYLLTLAAIAKEIRQRNLPPECSVRIAAGLPLTSFGRDKPKFREYLLRSNQPVNYKFEGVEYSITIEEVAVFPQGYAALMTE
ncbi:ParM/StbA family protein, partial [Gemmiger formicilis]